MNPGRDARVICMLVALYPDGQVVHTGRIPATRSRATGDFNGFEAPPSRHGRGVLLQLPIDLAHDSYTAPI